jgi:recombination DNA repair RAD52 pathway protein
MPINDHQRAKLLEGLHPGRISTRAAKKDGTGPQLSYIEAWDARATLIRIFGFGGFSAEVIDVRLADKQAVVGMRLTVFGIGPDGQDVHYTEYAADTAAYKELDDLVKTAESEALKRCCINLGDQFGLSLYNNGSIRPVIVRTLDQPQPTAEEERANKVDEMRQKITDLTNPAKETKED